MATPMRVPVHVHLHMHSQQSRSAPDMASDSTMFDVIVVGAGVEGSATAYQLIKNGAKRVLLLEQFAALHTRGSSGGSSRITRRVYKEAFFVHMMVEAFKTWERLEKEYGQQLYKRTGILVFGQKGRDEIEDIKKSLSINSVPYQVFPGNEANRRYPSQLKLPSDYECVFEDDGGILFASRCLAAFQKLFVKGGGVIKDYHQVTEVIPGGGVVTVKTNKGNFEAKKVVITTGPWGPAMAKKMGIELPFKITRVEVLYWKVDEPEVFSADCFPVFKICGGTERNEQFYGLPALEYPGLVKICLHTGPEVEPDHRDADPAPNTTEVVANAIKAYFKGVSTTPAIYEPCMYTESPDWCPVLDRHPQYPNIIMGFGLSGHGFKLSPVIGKMLCELALDLPPSYDLSPFKINRFQSIGAKL